MCHVHPAFTRHFYSDRASKRLRLAADCERPGRLAPNRNVTAFTAIVGGGNLTRPLVGANYVNCRGTTPPTASALKAAIHAVSAAYCPQIIVTPVVARWRRDDRMVPVETAHPPRGGVAKPRVFRQAGDCRVTEQVCCPVIRPPGC
jgi:hypothetical protein